MATVDSNGITIYQETDSFSPVSTLLNIGMSSVSEAISGLKNGDSWLTLSVGLVNVVAKRAGNTVTVHCELDGSLVLTDNIVELNGGAAIIPAEMRPYREAVGSASADQPGVMFHAGLLVVRVNGSVAFIKPPQATRIFSGTVTYNIA